MLQANTLITKLTISPQILLNVVSMHILKENFTKSFNLSSHEQQKIIIIQIITREAIGAVDENCHKF